MIETKKQEKPIQEKPILTFSAWRLDPRQTWVQWVKIMRLENGERFKIAAVSKRNYSRGYTEGWTHVDEVHENFTVKPQHTCHRAY